MNISFLLNPVPCFLISSLKFSIAMKKILFTILLLFPLQINAQSVTLMPTGGSFLNYGGAGITGQFRTGTGNSSTTLTAFTEGSGKAAHVGITNNTSSADAFEAITFGSGRAGYFSIFTGGSTSTGTALEAVTDANGRAGLFSNVNSNSTANALEAKTAGEGTVAYFETTNSVGMKPALYVKTSAIGRSATFEISNTNNSADGLSVEHSGPGDAVNGYSYKTGRAGFFINTSSSNTNAAIHGVTNGTGTTLVINHTGSSGNLAAFQNSASNVARIDKTGKGFFNGGTQNSGADIAEAFDVVGTTNAYEAGDVLTIATSKNRTVEKSSKAYSTLVAGVYATKPGVLLTEENIDTDISDKVPMGVVGVIPTKVCNEGGEIHIGDMLVTSSRTGFAMRGSPKKIKIGQVIGKALEDFNGQSGKINVLVSVR